MVLPIVNIAAKMNAQLGRDGNLINGESADGALPAGDLFVANAE